MKFKLVMFILLGLIFTLQNVYANSDVDLDTIPEEYRFPNIITLLIRQLMLNIKAIKEQRCFLVILLKMESVI